MFRASKIHFRAKASITNRKTSFFVILFFLLLILIYVKLFNIQVIDSSRYQLAAKKQYESKISLKPSRGIIFDRKLNPLVSSANSFSYAADPNMVDNKDSIASLFASVFSKEKEYYLDKLNSRNTSFVWLERHINQKKAAELEGLNLSGVIKLNESQRVFNYEQLASQVIGHTDVDNNGISGIELQYNDVLCGEEGYVVMQKDGLGRKRPAIEFPRVEPQDGNNLQLTIDINIQKIIEEELDSAVHINNADGAKCVVMAVKTGEILGIYSAFNKENPTMSSRGSNLTAITDLYEPGSTFKLVTAAASLEEGIQNKNDIIQTNGGEYEIYGLKIKDAHKFSNMSFQKVVEQSSNVGMIQVANKLGEKKFYKYARDFGFGNTTGLDFPGESKGSLKKPVNFTPVSLKFMAIGYEVMVNALQMTNAFACVANNGILMKPFLVKKELLSSGNVLKEYFPIPIRSVISKNTSRTLTELLYGVVERGTGVEAKINNIKIAGKTGTSQKLINGKYSKSEYTASFVGYFPAENPKIVISVIMDAPKSNQYYGGKVAAPVFRNIAERIINLTGLLDSYELEYKSQENSYVKNVSVPEEKNKSRTENINDVSFSAKDEYPNLVGFDLNDALQILNENEIKFEIISKDGSKVSSKSDAFIVSQEILNNGKDNSLKKIKLVVSLKDKDIENSTVTKMPDLKGYSLRKAIKLLSSFGLNFSIMGYGKVISQTPYAGGTLNKNQHITIICESAEKELIADNPEK